MVIVNQCPVPESERSAGAITVYYNLEIEEKVTVAVIIYIYTVYIICL